MIINASLLVQDLLLALLVAPPRYLVAQAAKTIPTIPERPQIVKDAFEKNKPLYYFGLGSNMSRKKLENRGINGTKIEIQTMEAAVVPNYRLAFNLRGFPPIEPGMGTLEPIESSSKALLKYSNSEYHGECHGALVRLTPDNYEKVMKSEGINGKSDQGYDEIVVDAYPYKRPRRPVKAIALRARAHARLNFDPCPSQRYMNILKEGANELGLKPCYQDFLAAHPVQQLPVWQKRVALYNLIFMATVSFRLKWRGISAVQSRLLYAVYVSTTVPVLRKLCSDLLITLILFPGAIVGFLGYQIMNLTGNTPPFMTRIMTLFGDSDSRGNEEEG
jgi:hypothetical protein